MIYHQLGKTGFQVSKICFGSLTIGPLQANLNIHQGAQVIKTALDLGINFIDTAELYQNYAYIKEALKGHPQDVVIATKSYAYSKELMARSLENARRELDRDRIDIFLLHEQESLLTLKGHWEAVEYLLAAKAKGIVGAVGISTHRVEGVNATTEVKEIEVIHPMLNMAGLGIQDGNVEDMLRALKQAKEAGKGIYGMKAIGGGNLMAQVEAALKWSFQLDCIDAVAIGMKSPEEVRINVAWSEGIEPAPEDLAKVTREPRKLLIEEYCTGCGRCLEKCAQGALSFHEGKSTVNMEKCVLCGYCASVCPDFYIKVI